MTIRLVEDDFGEAVDPFTKTQKIIKRFTFTNDLDIEVQIITLGATITSIKIPDDCGERSDIILGFDDVYHYQNNPYFGTVGRVAGRISYAKFELNGEKIDLSKNYENTHHLHGGLIGFDQVIWDAKIEDKTVIMTHVSKDGHEGYPGELYVEAKFELCRGNCFRINYAACSSKETVINITNHAYFNLGGHESGEEGLLDHLIKIKADRIIKSDDDFIPNGDFIPVAKTPYDFTKLVPLADQFKALLSTGALGFDHSYCVDSFSAAPVRRNSDANCLLVAKAVHAKSGRWLEVHSNQPCIHFYTANYFPDFKKDEAPVRGKDGAKYYKNSGFCFESQKYPDAVHHAHFPTITLKPDQTYNHDLVFKFGICIGDHQLCKASKAMQKRIPVGISHLVRRSESE